ncbi:MAG: hypothetical protein V9E82_09180, partial [Candidatus Nanopelagicales bacterium]
MPEEETTPVRLAFDDLAQQRAIWRSLPAPPAPPGRDFTYAGAATRLLGLGIDLLVVGYLNTVLFSTIGGLLDTLFDGSPPGMADSHPASTGGGSHSNVPGDLLLGSGPIARDGHRWHPRVHRGRSTAWPDQGHSARLGRIDPVGLLAIHGHSLRLRCQETKSAGHADP